MVLQRNQRQWRGRLRNIIFYILYTPTLCLRRAKAPTFCTVWHWCLSLCMTCRRRGFEALSVTSDIHVFQSFPERPLANHPCGDLNVGVKQKVPTCRIRCESANHLCQTLMKPLRHAQVWSLRGLDFDSAPLALFWVFWLSLCGGQLLDFWNISLFSFLEACKLRMRKKNHSLPDIYYSTPCLITRFGVFVGKKLADESLLNRGLHSRSLR